MPINIPNLKIKALLEMFISIIRADYQEKLDNGLENESWLYRVFHGVTYGNFDYYKQAKEIIINRDVNNPRRLNIRNSFSLVDKPQTPTIHINVPSEQQKGANSIGMNLDSGSYFSSSESETEFNEIYARYFEGSYELIVTSPNFDECELLYRLLQALFIAAADTLNENFDGTFNFSGKQIIVNPALIPTPLFIKVWVVTVQQKIDVPILPVSEYLGDVEFEGHMYSGESIG